MKENDFTPSNEDQKVLDKVAEFTAGSPLIVDITSQVVHSCFNDREEPIQALEDLLCLENSPSLSKREYAMHVHRSKTRSASENATEVEDNVPQHVWTTNVEYDSWDSILTLINACGLTTEERVLLNSLSVFSGSPIPFSMVTELASVIAKPTQKPHLAGSLHCNLIRYKLVCIHPHPVVLHPTVLRASSAEQKLGPDFVYVPQYLSQCIWKSLEDIDRVVVYNLAYHALVAMQQNHMTSRNGIESEFYGAMCSLLLESLESNFELVGKQCYQAVYSLFLKL